MTLQLGVLVSGNGTNLQAIINSIKDGFLDAKIKIVISNKLGIPALDRAIKASIPTEVILQKSYKTRVDFDLAIVNSLKLIDVNWIILAGFMRILTKEFIDAFPLRVINIHPALLPAFPGLDAQAQALAYGAKITGCTVHLVDAGMDTGPIIAQAAVPILNNDTRESLAKRVLSLEHQVLISVLKSISEDKLYIEQQEGMRPHVIVKDGTNGLYNH